MSMLRFRVAVLYTHPLFGQGIARLLSEDPTLEVVCLRAEAADVPSVATILGVDAVVMEDWGNPAHTNRVIQALPPTLVAIVRLHDNAMEVYRGRRRILPRTDNLLELMHEMPGRNVVSATREQVAQHHRSAS
jgi:DNA-binding NarL/FixJ family response regulator